MTFYLVKYELFDLKINRVSFRDFKLSQSLAHYILQIMNQECRRETCYEG